MVKKNKGSWTVSGKTHYGVEERYKECGFVYFEGEYDGRTFWKVKPDGDIEINDTNNKKVNSEVFEILTEYLSQPITSGA